MNQLNLSEQFMVQQMTKTNHILHLVLAVITCGVWVPIWILIAMNNASKRSGLTNGPVSKVLNLIGKVLLGGLLFCVGIAALFMACAAIFFK